jgi:hypothetical protein
LLVNGSPVSQATVIAVLEVLYSNMWALGFEAPSRKGQQSVTHLLNMLLFADAVGCSKQALSQLAGLIGRFRLEVCVCRQTVAATMQQQEQHQLAAPLQTA